MPQDRLEGLRGEHPGFRCACRERVPQDMAGKWRQEHRVVLKPLPLQDLAVAVTHDPADRLVERLAVVDVPVHVQEDEIRIPVYVRRAGDPRQLLVLLLHLECPHDGIGDRDLPDARLRLRGVDGVAAASFLVVLVVVVDERVVDADVFLPRALVRMDVAVAQAGTFPEAHPRVQQDIEDRVPVPVLRVVLHVVQEQLLLLPCQRFPFLGIVPDGQPHLPDHVVGRVLADHVVIHRDLQDLVQHGMDVVQRGKGEAFVFYEIDIESPDVRPFDMPEPVPAEDRLHMLVVHVHIVLLRAVLDPALEVFPELVQVVQRHVHGGCPDAVMAVDHDLLFLFAQFGERWGVDGAAVPEHVGPSVTVSPVRPLPFARPQPHMPAVIADARSWLRHSPFCHLLFLPSSASPACTVTAGGYVFLFFITIVRFCPNAGFRTLASDRELVLEVFQQPLPLEHPPVADPQDERAVLVIGQFPELAFPDARVGGSLLHREHRLFPYRHDRHLFFPCHLSSLFSICSSRSP